MKRLFLISLFLYAQLIWSQCKIVYVTPSATNNGLGTKSDPIKLQKAIKQISNGDIIRLANGTYTVDSALQIVGKKHIIIEGGFSDNLNWKKSTTLGATQIIRSSLNPAGLITKSRLVAIELKNCDSTLIQDLSISVTNSTLPSQSNYGLYLNQCSNYHLIRLKVKSGNAANGSNGADGVKGVDGAKGDDGQAGDIDNLLVRTGGKGGNGGSSTNIVTGGSGGSSSGSVNGIGGTTTSIPRAGGGGGGGGAGGQANKNGGNAGSGGGATPLAINNASLIIGGAWGNPGKPGTKGNDGQRGIDGVNGALANPFQFLDYFEIGGNGQNGTSGTGGTGGTGGSGGGGQDCTFCVEGTGNSAGGGGGGGEGGSAGQGGSSGGGSFGIYIFNNGINGNILDCKIESGLKGIGGLGGKESLGGTGGPKGIGAKMGMSEIGIAGDGGKGGDGGNGGKGGDGVDGVAFAIKLVSGTPLVSEVITTDLASKPVILTSELTENNQYVTVEAITNDAVQWNFASEAVYSSTTLNPNFVSFQSGTDHLISFTSNSNTYNYPKLLCNCNTSLVTIDSQEFIENKSIVNLHENQLKIQTAKPSTFFITNLTGSKLIEGNINVIENIDVSNYNSGIYMVYITDLQGKSQIFKILK